MNPFAYRHGRLHAEALDLSALADEVGTPCYVYSRTYIEERWRAFDAAFGGRDHLVCYALKANSNLAVLDLLARLGSGFDITSVGELERVLAAAGDPAKVVFSGVGKTEPEMRRALQAGIGCFNVESANELELLNRVAGGLGVRASVSVRVNPDVDPKTHPYIATGLKESKFGVDIDGAVQIYRRTRALEHIAVRGVAFHIGSQLTDVGPLVMSFDRVLDLAEQLLDEGFALEHIDMGGGLGIRYSDEEPPAPQDYVRALLGVVDRRAERLRNLRLMIEPGRSIVGNAGVLLTRVIYLKEGPARNFAVVDAAMNDLLRPALYDAWHDILPLVVRPNAPSQRYDVVGPVCETGDFLGQNRALAVAEGDYVAVMSAGAYGAVMSSNYNTRPRVPEVLVEADRYCIVRRRETVAELLALETRLPQS